VWYYLCSCTCAIICAAVRVILFVQLYVWYYLCSCTCDIICAAVHIVKDFVTIWTNKFLYKLFPSVSSTKILYVFLFSPVHATFPAHFIHLQFSIWTFCGQQCVTRRPSAWPSRHSYELKGSEVESQCSETLHIRLEKHRGNTSSLQNYYWVFFWR
jgi:hypothetical protein